MDDTRSSKALNEFRANACEAISFKMIRTKADFEGGVEFHPEFAHQIFGERFEVIDPQQDGEAPSYAFIGYMTIFKFYAYPANLRPRLSQVLILPPFRNNGHASELLQTFYRDFVHIPNVRDITGKFTYVLLQVFLHDVMGHQ
ncbi:hypothetical protein X801_05491 [Opisthorchis viverrini]|uniref:Histone acetyl transferase HAT1 N-terminal domain-containing protein n=1 Tax=Opisthorchis viverrini TaxID=6198 RepID=A0A1S8WW86_OPIVI|nr:hypothetical protein X801_05491 [Opisthorchis viverrini]